MNGVSMSGNDTVIINGRIMADFADGKIAELKFPNKIAKAKKGKNGNTLYAFDATGAICEFTFRLLRGSADDIYMQSQITQQNLNFAGYVLMTGEFIKQIGDGQGNITNDTYVMSGGINDKNIEASSSVEGDTDQSVSHYSITFSNAPRAIT